MVDEGGVCMAFLFFISFSQEATKKLKHRQKTEKENSTFHSHNNLSKTASRIVTSDRHHALDWSSNLTTTNDAFAEQKTRQTTKKHSCFWGRDEHLNS